MRDRSLTTLLGLVAPLGSLLAADLPTMAPTPSNPPAEGPSRTHLVDRVIPAYGTVHYRPYRMESRTEDLYNQVREFSADLEARVMGGGLALPPVSVEQPLDENGLPVVDAEPVYIPRARLPEEERLAELLGQVAIARETILLPEPL